MIFKGVNVEYKCIPVLDTEFVPLALFVKRYQKNAHMPVNIEISGAGRSSNYHTFIIGNQNSLESDIFYLERCIKALLWCRGGNIVRLYSDCEFLREIIRELSRIYHTEGERSFDVKTMSDIFEKPFIIGSSAYKEMQNDCQETEKKYIKTTEKKADGFRLGIDLGGSSIKISALSDGNVIFSDRTEWRPFQESNASYHYNKILEALKLGADKLPHVDFIGISSAGIIINNRIRLSSLVSKRSEGTF